MSTIIVIAAILIASVMGLTMIQRREQAKAKLRQQVGKYRYRANEAASILDNFGKIPIGKESRQLLLQYIQLNLSAAVKLMPGDSMLVNNLNSINQQLQNPESPIDKQKLTIPKDPQQLSLLIKQLSKLGNYLLKFKTIKAMNAAMIPLSVNKIMLLISEAKICAYIQQGQKALAEHIYVNAQRHFQVAQKMLDKFPKKNARLSALESELKELVSSTPAKASQTNLSINNNQEPEEKGQDNIFGPKKKW